MTDTPIQQTTEEIGPPVPSDVRDYGARHGLEEWAAATYRAGYRQARRDMSGVLAENDAWRFAVNNQVQSMHQALALLRCARDDLTEAAIERYPHRAKYPSDQARWMRDMELPERINAMLSYYDGFAAKEPANV